jgi:hypothetical protein
LCSAGEVAGAPIATCRLLLAPRPDERAEVDQLTGGAYGAADFTSVRAATEAWGDSILAGGTEADSNVAFFFFSGHGTEYLGSPALLTSDILNPKSAGASHKAVALLSLCQAVKTYGIDRALFFVDACRDAPGVARRLHIVGEDILKPYADPPKSHEALICLQSTKSGGSAYQVPQAPATIFGQAVLDALEGPPPSHRPYDTAAVPWQLVFKNLESHVKQAVIRLLRNQTATLLQSVVPYGDPYHGEMLVAEKQGPSPQEAVGPPPTTAAPPPLGSPPSAPEMAGEILRDFKTSDANELSVLRTQGAHDELADFDMMHEIFGHEYLTIPWLERLKILDVETGQPVRPDSVQLLQGNSQELAGTFTAWVDVVIAPHPGQAVWISAGGSDDEPSFAVAIPRDINMPLPARLDIALRKAGPQWKIAGLSARIGDPSGLQAGPQSVWSALWDMQRQEILSNLAYAGLAARQLADLEGALMEKTRSPIAAMVATTVLIRCGALDQLHDWPLNLANWFEWLPDGPVLWAETLLRRDELARSRRSAAGPPATRPGQRRALLDDPAEVRRLLQEPAYEEALVYFSKLADRGPPRLAATLGMAVRQMPFWKRVLEIQAVTDQAHRDLRDACEVVQRAAEYASPDGLFAGFVSRAGAFAPQDVLGVRRKAAANQQKRAAA